MRIGAGPATFEPSCRISIKELNEALRRVQRPRACNPFEACFPAFHRRNFSQLLSRSKWTQVAQINIFTLGVWGNYDDEISFCCDRSCVEYDLCRFECAGAGPLWLD